jgi:hypothetical protein
MGDAWEDLGAKWVGESYAEALARSLVGKVDGVPTEQEIVAKIVADRERMRVHDRVFSDDYLPISEQVIVSRTLARQLGYAPHDNSLADDGGGWAGGDD